MSISNGLKAEVFKRSGGICGRCGTIIEVGKNFTCDHYIPTSKGGETRIGNLVGLCVGCNKGKSNTIVEPSWYRYVSTVVKNSVSAEYLRYKLSGHCVCVCCGTSKNVKLHDYMPMETPDGYNVRMLFCDTCYENMRSSENGIYMPRKLRYMSVAKSELGRFYNAAVRSANIYCSAQDNFSLYPEALVTIHGSYLPVKKRDLPIEDVLRVYGEMDYVVLKEDWNKIPSEQQTANSTVEPTPMFVTDVATNSSISLDSSVVSYTFDDTGYCLILSEDTTEHSYSGGSIGRGVADVFQESKQLYKYTIFTKYWEVALGFMVEYLSAKLRELTRRGSRKFCDTDYPFVVLSDCLMNISCYIDCDGARYYCEEDLPYHTGIFDVYENGILSYCIDLDEGYSVMDW